MTIVLCVEITEIDNVSQPVIEVYWISIVKCVKSPDQVNPDYKIGICCFSAKYTSLRREQKWVGSESE